jgi:hypothetical protein
MNLGRILLVVGLAFVFGGVLLMLAERVPFLSWMGKLPGDIRLGQGSWRLHLPIATCIVLSIVLTMVLKVGRFLLLRFFT